MTSLLGDTARLAAALTALLLVVRCTPFEAASSAPDAGPDVVEPAPTAEDAATIPIDAGARSCAELRARGATETRVYMLAATPDAAALEVFCQMAIDDGGWTLVGRSAAGEKAVDDFGWRSTRGAITGAGAYSLDARRLPSPLSEVLIVAGSETTGPIFRKALPADFLVSHLNKTTSSPTTTLLAACTPSSGASGGPNMLRHIGYTYKESHFHFRDNGRDDGDFGLFPAGWRANGGNCEGAGALEDKQASIFVR